VSDVIESIQVTYQGMMQRADGRRLALIQQGGDSAPAFILEGEQVAGRILASVERTSIELQSDAEQASMYLEVGVPTEVDVP
jgi:hypothetical protein